MFDASKNFKNVFTNKSVIITGHTGFKGAWLSIWLNLLGAKVIGISKDIPSQPSLFESSKIKESIVDYRKNIKDIESLSKIFLKTKPDFVFHLAAQPLVRKSYEDPIETWNSNSSRRNVSTSIAS